MAIDLGDPIAKRTAMSRTSIHPDLAGAMNPKAIGERLVLLRTAFGLRSSEVADLLGVDRAYYNRFEHGKRMVSDSVAVLLVDRFGVTLDWLILGRSNTLTVDLAEKLRAAMDEPPPVG
ncbi:helix-turn-helix domain-containing protein [Histidinibacterium aquaticum]|nr:helix-turn-helix transcriptional regulator [Histidinibacterium aquaticum]